MGGQLEPVTARQTACRIHDDAFKLVARSGENRLEGTGLAQAVNRAASADLL